jgi:hypothetical protein
MGSIDSFIAARNAELAGGFAFQAPQHQPQHQPPHTSQNQPDRRHWTLGDVQARLGQLHAPADRADAAGSDFEHSQRQLCAAFLAGVTESREEQPLRPGPPLAAAALQNARVLLKNRAMSPPSRLWHAFMAGIQLARSTAGSVGSASAQSRPLKIFVRQPFTESDQAQQALIAGVLGQIEACNAATLPLQYLAGKQAESADTFRSAFEAETGRSFSPQAFRAHRLQLLAQAEAFINIRVGMSESSAFELSYHIFKGACTPVLFLVWKHAPIKTTLLKDLQNLCDVTYLEFEHPGELRSGIEAFFSRQREATPALKA